MTGFVQPRVEQLAIFWAVAIITVPSARASARVLMRRQPAFAQRALVVGAGLVGQEIARKIQRQPAFGLELVGFVDGDPLPLHHELEHVPVLGATRELGDVIERYAVDHVVLAFTTDHEAGLDVVRVCNDHAVQVDIVPRLFEVVGSRASVRSLEGTPLLGLTPPVLGPSHRIAKRSMDIAGAAVRADRAEPDHDRYRDRGQAHQQAARSSSARPAWARDRSRSPSSSSAPWSPTPRTARPRSRI